jgi:hypothetical protein
MNSSGIADLVTHVEELKQQMQMQARTVEELQILETMKSNYILGHVATFLTLALLGYKMFQVSSHGSLRPLVQRLG